jgi:hypothetical protein
MPTYAETEHPYKSTEEDGGALANYGYMLANGWGVQVDVPAAVAKFEVR